MIKKIILLCIGYLPFSSFAQNNDAFYDHTVFIKLGEISNIRVDSLLKIKTAGKYYCRIQPVIKEYGIIETANHRASRNDSIEYRAQYLKKVTNDLVYLNEFLPSTAAGTYYLAFDKDTTGFFSSFKSLVPINQKFSNVFQIVIRKDDSYVGFLEELFHTPFILSPKTLLNGKHQVDSRIGSDCASFAIYGVRRLGYKVPYCGPRKIYAYLTTICDNVYKSNNVFVDKNKDSVDIKNKYALKPGDILHFREQVAVFYEDKGVVGMLDKDDLIIQSYISEPVITTIENGGFYGREFGLYRWNWGGLPR